MAYHKTLLKTQPTSVDGGISASAAPAEKSIHEALRTMLCLKMRLEALTERLEACQMRETAWMAAGCVELAELAQKRLHAAQEEVQAQPKRLASVRISKPRFKADGGRVEAVPLDQWSKNQAEDILGMSVVARGVQALDDLPLEIQTTVSQLVREALAGMRQYGAARRAVLKFKPLASTLQVEIEADGDFFSPRFLAVAGGRFSVQNRVEKMGGSYQLSQLKNGHNLMVMTLPQMT